MYVILIHMRGRSAHPHVLSHGPILEVQRLDLDLEQKYPKIEHFTVFLRLLSSPSRHNAAQIIGLKSTYSSRRRDSRTEPEVNLRHFGRER